MDFSELRKYDTLMQTQNVLTKEGFTEQFEAKDGKITGLSNQKTYEPNDLLILVDKRFEGMSNPADNMVLYVIEAKDGTKGTLLDNVGGADSVQDPALIKAIPMTENHNEE